MRQSRGRASHGSGCSEEQLRNTHAALGTFRWAHLLAVVHLHCAPGWCRSHWHRWQRWNIAECAHLDRPLTPHIDGIGRGLYRRIAAAVPVPTAAAVTAATSLLPLPLLLPLLLLLPLPAAAAAAGAAASLLPAALGTLPRLEVTRRNPHGHGPHPDRHLRSADVHKSKNHVFAQLVTRRNPHGLGPHLDHDMRGTTFVSCKLDSKFALVQLMVRQHPVHPDRGLRSAGADTAHCASSSIAAPSVPTLAVLPCLA